MSLQNESAVAERPIPEPLKTWKVPDDEDENEVERGLKVAYVFQHVSDNEWCRFTSYVVPDFEVPGLTKGRQIPYFIDSDTDRLPPADVWERYFETFRHHALRLAASISRVRTYPAFVFHYHANRSELHLVENFEPFSEAEAIRDLDNIWKAEP